MVHITATLIDENRKNNEGEKTQHLAEPVTTPGLGRVNTTHFKLSQNVTLHEPLLFPTLTITFYIFALRIFRVFI